MKKVISIMVVLCIAASLFATGTLKVGGTFNFVSGKTAKFSEEDLFGSAWLYDTKGFGFDVSAGYDLANGLTSWVDFNMTFNSDIKSKADGSNEWYTLSDLAEEAEALIGNAAKAKTSVTNMSFAAGVAFKLPVAESVEVAVGGGIFADRINVKVTAAKPSNSTINSTYHDVSYTERYVNIGITGYADVAYKFTENYGVALKVMPRVGLFNVSKNSYDLDTTVKTYKATGFALSFSMPVVIGVSYSF